MFRSTVLAVALLTCAGAAQAAPVVDQADIPATGALSGNSGGFGVNQDAFLVQTFTVGLTGQLTQFDLAIVGTPLTTDGGFTVSLRDASETELFSTHVDYAAAPNVFATDWTSMLQFDLGVAAFGVVSGQLYSIAVRADPAMPPGGVTWLTEVDSTRFDYAGGQGLVSYFGAPPQAFRNDYGFRTYVDAAVPEPAAWALMILGFGATGAALRRRTAAAA